MDNLEVTTAGRWFVIGCFFVLGGVLGSFVNVVVYRMPRRMSLSFPGSRCPACERSIRWHDNVPILGWLWLGGRCRDCGAPISARYPIVEALVASIAALLAWKEGARTLNDGLAAETIYLLQLLPVFYHLILSCALVSAALIEIDGQVPPGRMFILPAVVGLVLPMWWPELRPRSDFLPGLAPSGTMALLQGVTGMICGLLIALGPALLWIATVACQGRPYATAAIVETMLVGAYLGDHAVVPIGTECMLLYFTARRVARIWSVAGRPGWAAPLTLASLGWMLTWPENLTLDPAFLGDSGLVRLLVGGTVTICLAIALRLMAPSSRPSQLG